MWDKKSPIILCIVFPGIFKIISYWYLSTPPWNYMGKCNQSLFTLNWAPYGRWVVSFMLWPLQLHYPLDSKVDESQSCSEQVAERKFLSLPWLNPSHPFCNKSLYTVIPAHSWNLTEKKFLLLLPLSVHHLGDTDICSHFVTWSINNYYINDFCRILTMVC